MKTFTLTTVLTLTLSFMVSFSVLAQQATTEQVQKLLQVMEAENQFITGLEAGLEMQKKSGQAAMLPEGFFEAFMTEAKAGYKTKLMPKIAEIHQQNLSEDEVKKLIDFYSTDLGKMMLSKMPTIQAEAANAGMVWGQQLGMEVAEKLMSKE